VFFVIATVATVGGCTKSPPGGNAVAYVARGDTHPADPAHAMLARTYRSEDSLLPTAGPCPANMASVGSFCIDRYEAALVEILPNGDERPFDSFSLAAGHVVRAVSERGVFPHGYISEVQAKDACARSGKRLCKADEWRKACMGPSHTTFGYGNTRVSGRCNDHGTSPMISVMQVRVDRPWTWTYDKMNDPRLNQAPSTLARTGEHASCTNGYGVYDMVGNLHEWVDDPDGTFQGGYYLDTHVNGDGCTYRTTAHGASYHDYSTGFRCCASGS
jgi:sulfatase modifying factor 1